MILVPGDVVRPRRPDTHLAAEAEAARAAGLDVAVVDHDVLAVDGDADAAVARVAGSGEAVYRGWMLRGGQYAALAEALARRGVVLRTTAAQYRRAHELPGWHAALAAVTPAAMWTVGDDRGDFERAAAELGGGAAVLRDYTKSLKQYWDEAAFIPDVADVPAAWRVASRFRELRGEDFAGGFVLRRFEPFTGAEVRTWWVDGVCRLITAHPDTPDTPDELPAPDMPLDDLAPLVQGLQLPFVTVDLTLRADGVRRVVELGDGQVSDRPATTSAGTLIAMLAAAGL